MTIRDHIDELFHLAEQYWRDWQLSNLQAGMIAKGNPLNRELMRKATEHDRAKNEARSKMVPVCRALAEELEASGEDSTALLEFLYAIDGGGGPEAAAPLWPNLKVCLQRIQMRPVTNGKPGDSRSDEQRVRDHIRERIETGATIEDITRDGIAAELGIAAARVSKTLAWKSLAAQRRQNKQPDTLEGQIAKASKAGDWKEVERLQTQEQRRQNRSS